MIGVELALERLLSRCIRAWARARPWELEDFSRRMVTWREQMVNLHGIEGLSRDGSILYKGEVPNALYQTISQVVDPSWVHIPEIRNAFFRLFEVGCINHTSESTK